MGISDWLGLGKAVAEPITAVSGLYTTDKARIEAETKYQEVAQKPQLAILETNRILALSSNVFKSGWPSMLGWTAGFLVLLYYFPQLAIMTYVWGKQAIATGIIKPFPMRPDEILNLVYLLFGFGTHNLASKVVTKR